MKPEESVKKEDITKDILNHFSSEIEDANNYYAMMENAEKMNDVDLAFGLQEMAYEEYTHAKFIKMVLDEYHLEIPDDICEKWKALEEKMEAEF